MPHHQQLLPDALLIATKDRRKQSRPNSKKMSVFMMLVMSTVALGFMSYNNLNSLSPNRNLDEIPNTSMSDRELQQDNDPRKIVWLFSYPESGTTYVMHVIHVVSQRSTASNYGTVLIDRRGNIVEPEADSSPVFSNYLGPSYSNFMPSPDKYVLTRTHSYGTCHNCPPWKYLGPAAYLKHMKSNTYGSVIVGGQPKIMKYDISLVEKMLILVRDPIDNVAARFMQKVQKEIDDGNAGYATLYPINRLGFKQYCEDMNNSPFRNLEQNWYETGGFWEEASIIPCGSEFVKIFTFYNHARLVGLQYNLEMKTVTIKDFAVDLENTLNDVFNYLELPRVNAPPENLLKNGEGLFAHFYTPEQLTNIALLAKKMTVPTVWESIEVFLGKYLPQE